MGEHSNIEWTDHTFNPWIGCTKVSAGCANCYAEALMDHRYGTVQWGPNGTRKRTSASNWKKPLTWNKQAAKDGKPARVFCASLADVFEDRDELVPWRRELFDLIDATPNLIWLLLTKRPENIARLLPGDMKPRRNVWFGTSVEDQEQAENRIPQLIFSGGLCASTFLSCEPLLGSLDLSHVYAIYAGTATSINPLTGHRNNGQCMRVITGGPPCYPQINWLIVGGESGPGKRPFNCDWARSLKDQCADAGVPFFMKQLDKVQPIPPDLLIRQLPAAMHAALDAKGQE